MNAATKTAIRPGNYIFATDNRGIAKDAIGDQPRMLDEVGRMTYDTRHQCLAGRHLDRLPGSPADFGKHIADDTEKWGKAVKLSGAKPE